MDKSIPTHAVKAVITNENGDILFLQRNPEIRADLKSNWDLPGGLVEDGESDIEALVREIDEEIRQQAKVGKELGRWSFFRAYDGATVEVTNYAVSITISELSDLILSNEHVEAAWVSKSELQNLDVKDQSIFSALG